MTKINVSIKLYINIISAFLKQIFNFVILIKLEALKINDLLLMHDEISSNNGES